MRAQRSNRRLRCRPPAYLTAPRPLPPLVLETLTTRLVLGTWRRLSRGEMDCFATLAMTESVRGKGNSWGVALVYSFCVYFIIEHSARFDFKPNSCSGPKGRTNSLLAGVENYLASYCINGCLRDRFSQKVAESAKFPAFFPATREFSVPGDCRIDSRRAAEEPTRHAGQPGLVCV